MQVQDLFHRQVCERASSVAIVAGNARLTYAELDSRASELASVLRSFGSGPDVVIGICMRRSIGLIVTALGILKAEAAYLPMDPADPPKRLGMILEQSSCGLVVTQTEDAEALPQGNWKKIVLDQKGLLPSHSGEISGTQSATPSDLAYVIFTSGSTGQPKGVQIRHANLSNLIDWHIRNFRVTPEDKATVHASPGFDASVWEVWPYLTAGASLHIVDDTIRTTPHLLRDWMVATGITLSFLPTALAEEMVALPWPRETALRFLLTGADTLHSYPRGDLPFKFVNNYGPTECTVVATSGIIAPEAEHDGLPTIGKPIDNVLAYIVDEELRQVADGACGELLIGGEGVGRGYLNVSNLTAQKFLPDPFTPAGDSRVYRTGDLVRRLSDGTITFLGRIDEQIKIRGYRIEPGEISAALNSQPGVEGSYVAAHADESGEPRLIAYIVINSDAILQPSQLREALAKSLPDYMVPSKFVRIASLPLTRNGKVDRTALPEPTPANMLTDDSFEPPQSYVEQWLAELLTSLLGVRRISRQHNFFRLGGHSLLGAQLIAKIQERFGVELSLRSVFDHPTVHGIAAEVDALIRSEVDAMSDDEARRVLESLSGGIAL